MGGIVDLGEVLEIKVGVDLCSRNIRVAQQSVARLTRSHHTYLEEIEERLHHG